MSPSHAMPIPVSTSHPHSTLHILLLFLLACLPGLASAAAPRFGHAAVYLPDAQQLLFVGGQTSLDKVTVVNDVLLLPLPSATSSSSLVSGANIQSPTELNAGSTANAWAAVAYDERARRILRVGGTTSSCGQDAAAYTLDGADLTSGWTIALSPTASASVPRRRFAQPVVLPSGDMVVLGGTADTYSCHRTSTVVAQLDIWSTTSSGTASVKSLPVDDQDVPLTQYAAVLLPDGRTIIYLGGLLASGDLASLDEVSSYDVQSQTWSSIVSLKPRPVHAVAHTTV